jgi:hypothetical protein
MRAAPFAVFETILEDPAQSGLMEDNDVLQALPSNGPDQALRVGVFAMGDRGAARTSRMPSISPFTELLSLNTIAVAQQVTRGVVSESCSAVHAAVGLEFRGEDFPHRSPLAPQLRCSTRPFLRQTMY